MNETESHFNTYTFVNFILKYIILALIISITAYYIPLIYKTSLRKPTINEVLSIGLISSILILLIDYITYKINDK